MEILNNKIGSVFLFVCLFFQLPLVPEVSLTVDYTTDCLSVMGKKSSLGTTDKLHAKTNSPNLIQSDSAFQLLHAIPIQSTYLTTDNLQNLYIATESGRIEKYDKRGKKQFEYNNKRLGSIGKIDAQNPFNILVYYPDFAVVIVLDRTLAQINELNLYDLDIIEPKAVTIANDNNIWIFDQVAAVLKKINQKGKILFESKNLNQLTQKNITPSFLLEQNNLLLLSDPKNGVFLFDTYGQLKQQVPILGIEQFQMIDQQIVYFKKGQLFSYSIDILKENKVVFPLKLDTNESAHIRGNMIFIAQKETVEVYVKTTN